MSFLTPLYIAGLLAVSLPILFHLFRRTPRGRVPFSSLMFLAPSPPRLTRRSRLENWPLLLLRALALILLALAFGRPFLRQALDTQLEKGQGTRIAMLIDTSASMRRGDLWEQAKQKAAELLGTLTPADEVAVYTFDRPLRPIVSFEQWGAVEPGGRAGLVRQHLQEVVPGWSATQLDTALMAAADLLENADGGQRRERTDQPRKIILISDLQAGSRIEALQSYAWPPHVQLALASLELKTTTNAGLHWVFDAETAGRTDVDDRPRVRVTNAADSTREQFQIAWADEDTADANAAVDSPTRSVDLYVPPGQSRVVRAPKRAASDGAQRLVLSGDDHDFDNTLWIVPPRSQQVTLLYFGTEAETDAKQPLYYLLRAFPQVSGRNIRVAPIKPGQPLLPGETDNVRLAIVADELPAVQIQWLRGLLARGGTVLLVLRTAAMADSAAPLADLEKLEVEEAESTRYAMLVDMDFKHPLFAPFADPRFSDFTKIHFWRHRTLKVESLPQARIVARFDDGSAALVEVPRGPGTLLILTAGWHPADSQLALSSKFVPLVNGILENSLHLPPATSRYEVGDLVDLSSIGAKPAEVGPVPTPPPPAVPPETPPATEPATEPSSPTPVISVPPVLPSLTVRKPDQTEVTLPAGETSFSGTDQPGIYTYQAADGPHALAVHLAAAESKTSRLPAEELEGLGVRLAAAPVAAPQAAEAKRQMQARELEGQQKLWRWLVVFVIVILIVETWWAGRAVVQA